MKDRLQGWAPWLLIAAMGVGLYYQHGELKASRAREAIHLDR